MSQKMKKISIKDKDIQQVIDPNSRHAYFANFFSLEVSNDDFTLGFGQKVPSSENIDIPVRELKHRIIMTHKGASTLLSLLQSAIKNVSLENKKVN